jgi:hypothetical protein
MGGEIQTKNYFGQKKNVPFITDRLNITCIAFSALAWSALWHISLTPLQCGGYTEEKLFWRQRYGAIHY